MSYIVFYYSRLVSILGHRPGVKVFVEKTSDFLESFLNS